MPLPCPHDGTRGAYSVLFIHGISPMRPSNPADLVWHAFDPLLQRIDALHAVADLCASYGPACVGLVLGMSALAFAGVVALYRSRATTVRGPDRRRSPLPMLRPDA